VLNRFDVTNRQGSVLTFVMEESDSGYQVADIEGLQPVKAQLVSTGYANTDGEQFQTAKRGPRNIVIKLDFDPDFTTKDYTALRNDLYSYFMPKSQINMRFYMDTGLYVDIVGHIEDIESPIFAQDPDATISIMCFQPDFVDARIVIIESGTVDDTTSLPINYPGTVETGIVVTLNVNRALPAFTIYNTDAAGRLTQLDFSGALEDGDQLVVSSLRGAKGITLIRDSISSSYLFGRSAQSSWIEFSQGLNQFRVYAPGDPVPYELEYVVRYGGL
jgi:hypothetical protein